MTKYTLIGVLSCVGGGLLIGFQMLSSIMGTKAVWRSSSLVDIVGEQYFEWMGNASLGGLERVAEYIVTMPLFVLLFCIGGMFFCVGLFSGAKVARMDLPFAQKRWCGAAGVDRVVTLSDHRQAEFGNAYGVLIPELRLLARAVFVVDRKGVVQHIQLVREIAEEPDYDAVLQALKKLV